MTIDTRRVESRPRGHGKSAELAAIQAGWHPHPNGHEARCTICEREDRLELEQGRPLPEWARNGGGLLVRRDGSTSPITAGTLGARRYPDQRPADHELELGACLAIKAEHVHYARAIGYPAGYWPEQPADEQRA